MPNCSAVCPTTGVAVQYGPVLRRQDGTLPTNTVPALVVGQDGALWLGTALGLTFCGGLYVSGGGPVGVPDGGTGVSSMTTHGVVIGEGTAAVHVTAAGTDGQLLRRPRSR